MQQSLLRPCLLLVPTPIGNLGDMTFRAVETLRSADLVAAEDTRTSGVLLKHYQIDTPLTALHMHNEHQRTPQLLDRVERESLRLAVVTDAGTPGISDPGFLIVREALKRGIAVEALPGPTAFVPALVASGLPCDRFVFEGFLPVKKGRQTRLGALAAEPRTMVLYESPHRLARLLGELSTVLGPERPAAVCRELSKLHEEVRRGSLAELAAHYTAHPPKGEIVVLAGGAGD
ncbi:MAG: 16S rRNA (cytidine(1402)-2'-O)-methyltransferase [Bacteroidia bacterium]|nr:16S rRNA (cytidine(1402)-2'-O)-methyltransferase [Bacteroidia bacterium]